MILFPFLYDSRLPYHVFKKDGDNKLNQEKKEIILLQNLYEVDLLVLARYMQILSDDFVQQWSNRIINIHHS